METYDNEDDNYNYNCRRYRRRDWKAIEEERDRAEEKSTFSNERIVHVHDEQPMERWLIWVYINIYAS